MSDDIRAQITSSLFTPDESGVSEKLLIYVKVFEDLKQSDAIKGTLLIGKPRYICLTQKQNKYWVYKTKKNQDGTFSIGKSWSLEEVKQVEVVNKTQFSMTLNKRHAWSVENPSDKMVFLAYIVNICQRVLHHAPTLVNIDRNYLSSFLTHRSAPPLISPASSPPESQQVPSPTRPTQNESEHIAKSSKSLKSMSSSVPSGANHNSRSYSTAASTSSSGGSQAHEKPSEFPTHPTATSSSPQFSPNDSGKEGSPGTTDRPPITQGQEDRNRDARKEKEPRPKQEEELEIQDKTTDQISTIKMEEILELNWKDSGNAAVLEKRLLTQLHALEEANVNAIIKSDDRVQSVVDRVDKALEELDIMETWLSLYVAELNSMGDDIHEIETQNRGLQVLTVNQNSLIDELGQILKAISIPREALDNLKYDPMETTDDITEIQNSAELLQRALKIKLEDDLHELSAVQETLKTYNTYNIEFSTRIFNHLKSEFDTQARLLMENKLPTQGKLAVAYPHDQVEDALIRYQGFSLWEKEMEPRMYNELQRHYASAMAPTYERDIQDMVEVTRSYYTTLRNRSVDEIDYYFRGDESRSARALAYGAKLGNVATGGSGGGGTHMENTRHKNALSGSFDSQRSSGIMDDDEKAAADAFSHLMNQCAIHVCREQNFVCDLFEQSPFAPKSFLDRGPVYASVHDKSRLYRRGEKVRDVKISKKVRNWMEIIFESFEPTVVPLVEFGLKSDALQAISMMASVEFQLEKWKESDQEFIFAFFDSLMLMIRRSFKQFVVDQIRNIEDTKVSSKKRRGILPSFRTFPLFVNRIEIASIGVENDFQTRLAINDAYDKVIKSMMSSLETNANDRDETGEDKEQLNSNIMYIENMHHFYHALHGNKLPILEKWIKEAKAKYELSVDTYIKIVIRRPLGKLLEFFDGIEILLRTTTPEEIAYHVNYNKTQLRKVIILYQPKDIRKSLEHLYKRVDKHFSEEEGLLQVIWRGIQEELIREHERIEGLISKCYPDTGLHLEFSIPDLLAMMGDQQTR